MNGLVINIDRRMGQRIVVALFVGVLSVSLLSFTANIAYILDLPGSRMALALFDVNEETSIATWWTSLVLGCLGILTAMVGSSEARNRGELLTWWALAAGFIFLSMDDGAMLHERVGFLLPGGGELHDSRWMTVWLPLAAVTGSALLWRLWRISRPLVAGLIVGAIVFLAGAVGVELINSSTRYQALQRDRVEVAQIVDQGSDTSAATVRDSNLGKRNYRYVYGTAIEEFLEMLGAVIWFAVILNAGIYGSRTQLFRNQGRNQ